MCDPENLHKCNRLWGSIMYSLCRTKKVRHVMTPPEESTNRWTCFPLELARLGVANGSYLTAGVFLVVGYVAGEIAGPSAIVSLIIAALVSLITGLCYAEYISHQPANKTSVTSPQYFYILSGEFTGTIVGWFQLCFYTCSGAVFARGVSATFDFLINNAITNITNSMTHKHSEIPTPDFLAGGIVVVIIIIVVFGGKVFECFTVTFSILSLMVLIPLTILSGIYGSPDNWTDHNGFFPFGHTGVFTGSAICVFLFGGYDVIATTSKHNSRDFRTIAIAILSSNIVNLIACLVLAMFTTLLVPYETIIKSRSLPTIFYQFGGKWGKYTIGLTAMLCLGSAVMNSVSCLVYTAYLMGADGVIPRGCATISKLTFTPTTAAILTGTICVLEAVFLDAGLLLEVVAIACLAHQTVICAATMATRYRPLEEDTNSDSQTPIYRQPVRKKTSKLKEHQESAKKSDSKNVMPYYDYSDLDSSATDNETDIDAVVDEYKDSIKQAKLTHIEGPKKNKKPPKPIPTIFTSTMAAISTVLTVTWCVAIAAILNSLLPFLIAINPWVITSICLFVCLLVITVIVLVLQPTREVTPAFRIPLFPVVPVLGIAINVFLLFSVSKYAWLIFGVWIVQGMCWYFCYGIHHSVESRRYDCQAPEEELILLQPLPEQPMNEELVNGQAGSEQNIGYQRYHETK